MSFEYDANADAAQPPSPVPGPGTSPKLQFPDDSTDGASWANVQQQGKANADHIAHVQKSVALDRPILNASNGGYSAVVANALGGTVTPSSSVHIADGTRFLIQIQLGGAVGVATFKTSMDGGATFGALQTTAASMTDATSGITLAFAGTFLAGGTAAFRSAFTPQAQWLDAAGNVRGRISHNGYRAGRILEYYEDWRGLGLTGSIAGGGAGRLGPSGPSGPAGVFWDLPASSAVSLLAQNLLMPGARALYLNNFGMSNGSTAVVYTAGFFSPTTFASLEMEFDVMLHTGASNTDFKIGLTSHYSGTSFVEPIATPLNSEQAFALVRQSADTQWYLLTGDTSNTTKTPTGVTPASAVGTVNRVFMELHGSASPCGTRARVFIDGNLVIDSGSITHMPTVDQPMGLCVAQTCNNASNLGELYVSPIRVAWNAYANQPPI